MDVIETLKSFLPDFFIEAKKEPEQKLEEAPGFPPDFTSPKELPYYPNPSYFEGKGKAPETTVTDLDLKRIASVEKTAIENGVLTPELAKYLLPMILVESRPDNYGVLQGSAFYAKPANVEIFKKMGMRVTDPKVDTTGEAFIENIKDKDGKDKGPHITLSDIVKNAGDRNAKAVAAILAIKSKLKDVKTPEDAVERFNGKGRAIERIAEGTQQADSANYRQKVQIMLQMLSHPKNAHILEMYQKNKK